MRIVYRSEEGGTSVVLEFGGADVSRAAVIPRLMRVGEAVVRVDGNGGTETEAGYRGRGVPGGWRDSWDEPDDSAEIRARMDAADRRLMVRAEVLGRHWQREVAAEQARKRRGGSG